MYIPTKAPNIVDMEVELDGIFVEAISIARKMRLEDDIAEVHLNTADIQAFPELYRFDATTLDPRVGIRTYLPSSGQEDKEETDLRDLILNSPTKYRERVVYFCLPTPKEDVPASGENDRAFIQRMVRRHVPTRTKLPTNSTYILANILHHGIIELSENSSAVLHIPVFEEGHISGTMAIEMTQQQIATIQELLKIHTLENQTNIIPPMS